MSGLPILQEIEQLVSKYADMSTPVDFLRALSQAAKLEEANILLHERMARDVYTIFGKTEDSDDMVSETGKKLLRCSKVTHYHHASSTLVFHTEAEVQFDLNDEQAPTKRKRGKIASSALNEPVFVKVQFSEQTLGAGSGTEPGSATREKGVSVLEAPYKSINLIISMRRGYAGLDHATLVDFQLLTSGRSPSTQRISLRELEAQNGGADESSHEENSSEGDREKDECSDGDSVGDKDGEEEEEEEWAFEQAESDGDDADVGGEDQGEEESEKDSKASGEEDSEGSQSNDDAYDTADYYNVNVDTEALAKLKTWLGFKSLLKQQEEEEEARAAEEEEEREKARKKTKSTNQKDGKGKGKGKQVVPPSPSPEGSEVEGDESGSEQQEEEGEEGEEMEVEGEPSAYDLDPALGDLLQFLLSLPYVDEAWGIHDLILDHELGAKEEEEEEYESDEEDGEPYCLPCCQ